MPDEHARLSPSSSDRWISCPASVRLIEKLPRDNRTSVYAEEGTTAHAMAELKARSVLLGKPDMKAMMALNRKVQEAGYDADEMNIHTDGYVDLLRDLLAEAGPGAVLLLEQRVNTGVQLCWGTADTAIVGASKLIIVDLKYGQGVPVDAYENPQLMLYGVGALETIADLLAEVDEVVMIVYQPRLNSTSRFTMRADDLRAWRDSLLPIVEEALHAPSPAFGPSDKACRWCPLAGECRARMEWATAHDFASDPDLLTVQELAEILKDLKGIRTWADSVHETAMRKAYVEGEVIPGWKVVRAAGRRSIPAAEHTHAIQTAIDKGYNAEEVATFKLKALGELEKALGKNFQDVLGSFIVKPDGAPSLVPECDKRPPIDRTADAAADFQADV